MEKRTVSTDGYAPEAEYKDKQATAEYLIKQVDFHLLFLGWSVEMKIYHLGFKGIESIVVTTVSGLEERLFTLLSEVAKITFNFIPPKS